jgi:hypothetical protein
MSGISGFTDVTNTRNSKAGLNFSPSKANKAEERRRKIELLEGRL